MTWEPQGESEYEWQGWGERNPFATTLRRLKPDEGWVCVPLVIVLCAIVGWSIADSRWILSEDRYTSFLIDVAVLGAVWGWVSSRLPIRRWAAHLIGAAIAAFVISIMVGYAIQPDSANPREAFNATAVSVTRAYLDLVWYRLAVTQQIGHFSLFLGVLVWGTAQAASYDVFGHRRPVNAVLLLAVVFVANMSLTIHDQFVGLVVFSIAALALLLQTHAADEKTAWVRHRIWRPRSTSTPHLRGGMAFASFAVVASLVLTTMASSAPLADAWPTVADNFRDFTQWVVRYLPQGGDTRIPVTGDFGTSSLIQTQWRPGDTALFKIRTQERGTAFHWRLITYDTFTKTGWDSSKTQKVSVSAGSPVEAGTQDAAPATGRVEQRFDVTVVDKGTHQVVLPNEPVSVTSAVDTFQIGGGQHMAYATTNDRSYSVVSLTPEYSPNGITENKLRAAGTDYPAGLKQMYTQGTEFVGDYARALLETIEQTAPDGKGYANAYDLGKAMQDYLRSPTNFAYQTDVSVPYSERCAPAGLSTPDCFAVIREGFCTYYATTMTMLMRVAGYPARMVQGYLPGSLDQFSPVYTVSQRDAHAWVEVFFPGYGWIEFDPTGTVGVTNIIPAGSPVSPSATPTPRTSGRNDTDAPRTARPQNPGGSQQTPKPNDGGTGIIIFSIAGLAAVLAILATVRLRRSRPPQNADVVYRGIARMAGWLGYKPQPTQTVYEYMGVLGGVIPQTRPHLEAVASAKVEVTYGRRVLGEERLRSLGTAQRRIRGALMRLAVRRPPIPFRRRRRRK